MANQSYPFTELPDPPRDAVSSVQFSPSGRSLLVAAWDSSVSYYTRAGGGDADFVLQERHTTPSPVLAACWGADDNTSFLAGLDQNVVMHADGLEEDVVLSSHEKAANAVAYAPAPLDLVLSTSWDATLHVHDPRTRQFVRVRLPRKAYALSLSGERAVVSMAERTLWVFSLRDLRMLVEQDGGTGDGRPVRDVVPWQQRESNLKFMMRSVACMPDGEGFATSSIDGRVSVEWFDPARDEDKYAFKCHRQTESDLEPGTGELREVDVIYPVNAVAFNREHGTFATGGGDGVVILWDARTKRRIRAYPKFGACVAAMNFSPDGRFLAVGVCTGFEDGLEGLPAEEVGVFVRRLEDNEAKGKAPKEKGQKA